MKFFIYVFNLFCVTHLDIIILVENHPHIHLYIHTYIHACIHCLCKSIYEGSKADGIIYGFTLSLTGAPEVNYEHFIFMML